jgi:hypothetical protein
MSEQYNGTADKHHLTLFGGLDRALLGKQSLFLGNLAVKLLLGATNGLFLRLQESVVEHV